MRISDWSSDVCSSDLAGLRFPAWPMLPADHGRTGWIWQPRKDSNRRMPESESGALPLGDGAMEPDFKRKARESRCTGPWLEARASRVRASCGRIRLTLRELGGAACLVQADLLALDLARVAGHEARRAQLARQRPVVLDQRAGAAQTDTHGLAGGAAAAGGDDDGAALAVLAQPERPAPDKPP